ncbi:MAG: hypothetical protein NTW19_20275 [Planctomycetota bacterium]|nr:hypothetical protein [Planctomycetota bacterium]
MPRNLQRHRGSIYLAVLGPALVIGLIGMGALAMARSQNRAGVAAADFATARLCANAGIEIALFKMRADPYWRTHLGNGAWFTNVALGQGRYSVTAADPISGDVTLASNHPVTLTSTGAKGSASYSLQVTVQATPTALSCLNVSMCSGGDTTLNASTLTSDQSVEANGAFSNGTGCTVNADVQAVGTINTAGTYTKSKQILASSLVLPDAVHVFDFYNANGTAISYASLYKSNATQLISNTSFESNTTGWYVYAPSSGSVTLGQNLLQHTDGLFSLQTGSRNGAGDVPATDLPLANMRCGDTYTVAAQAYASGLTANVQATIVVVTSTGTQSFSASPVALKPGGGWVNAGGNIAVSWTGTLIKATLKFDCTSNTGNLLIDAVGVTDSSLPSSAYLLDRVVLSPASNPYGSTNAKGIYLLDCGGKSVTIGPCRIVGTLVVTNAGSGTTIQGPIVWEPALANYPALLTDKAITLTVNSAVGLSESTYGVNLNPTNTPYPYVGGSANAVATDGYPSVINGIVYCGADLTTTSNTSVKGMVVSAGKINVNATSLNLSYGSAPFILPPPGFGAQSPAVAPIAGTWQRVVN